MGSAPDYIEPTVAWRTWLVVEAEEGMRLSSVVYPTLWPPRSELVAACRHRRLSLRRPWRRRSTDHGAPEERCRCGIYGTVYARDAAAYYEGHVLLSEPRRWPVLRRVLGRVFLWGSVVECEGGWRAPCAYPERLFVPLPAEEDELAADGREVADGLAVYGVEVDLLRRRTFEENALFDDRFRALLRHGAGREEGHGD